VGSRSRGGGGVASRRKTWEVLVVVVLGWVRGGGGVGLGASEASGQWGAAEY